jgi:phosphoglucomutase
VEGYGSIQYYNYRCENVSWIFNEWECLLMKQQFTIRIEIEKIEDAEAIWRSLKTGKIINGIRVTAVTNGDLFKRLNLTEEQLDIYMESYCLSVGLDSEDQEKFDELQNAIDKTGDREL